MSTCPRSQDAPYIEGKDTPGETPAPLAPSKNDAKFSEDGPKSPKDPKSAEDGPKSPKDPKSAVGDAQFPENDPKSAVGDAMPPVGNPKSAVGNPKSLKQEIKRAEQAAAIREDQRLKALRETEEQAALNTKSRAKDLLLTKLADGTATIRDLPKLVQHAGDLSPAQRDLLVALASK